MTFKKRHNNNLVQLLYKTLAIVFLFSTHASLVSGAYEFNSIWVWDPPQGNLGVDLAAVDKDGNRYFVGGQSGNFDFDPNLESEVILPNGDYIAKYDSANNLLWAGTLPSGLTIHEKIVFGPNNEIHLAGRFQGSYDFDPGPGEVMVTSPNPSRHAGFVLKIDQNGNYLWHKVYGTTAGSSFSAVNSIAVSANGKVAVTGSVNGIVNFDPGNTDTSSSGAEGYVLLLDPLGNFLDYTGGWFQSVMEELIFDADENLFVGGKYTSAEDLDQKSEAILSNDKHGAVFMKWDQNLNPIWTQFLETQTINAFVERFAIDNAGNLIITGSYTGSGVFSVNGEGFDLPNVSFNSTIWMAKVDSANGSPIWTHKIVGYATSTKIEIGPDNRVLLLSRLPRGTSDVDPGPASFPMSDSQGLFFLELNDKGDFMTAGNMGNSNTSTLTERLATYAENGDILIYGSINKSAIDVDPAVNTNTTNVATGTNALYILTISPIEGLPELTSTRAITTFVNETFTYQVTTTEPATNLAVSGTGISSVNKTKMTFNFRSSIEGLFVASVKTTNAVGSSYATVYFSNVKRPTFEDWAELIPDESQRGPLDDPAGLGIPNINRYAFNIPSDLSSILFNLTANTGTSGLPIVFNNGADTVFQYIKRDDPDLEYEVQFTDIKFLNDDSWQTLRTSSTVTETEEEIDSEFKRITWEIDTPNVPFDFVIRLKIEHNP